MSFNWQKIFNLVKRTGDKLIVCDSGTNSAVVVMNLEKYEKLLNKAEWGSDEFMEDDGADLMDMEEDMAPEETPEDAFTTEKKEENDSDDLYYLEPVA